jgi:methyltransferase (TIGR00027 family)
MQLATPSRTALRVALRRAAHQLYDRPLVFEDPIAVPLLANAYAEELNRTPRRSDRPYSLAMRAHLVGRSRYAEDNLARAVTNGATQYVLLGAGLDTFAYRNPWPQLQVFEVDHPATQTWKHELLRLSGLAIPQNLTYVPVNFEDQSLEEELRAKGFDFDRPSYFAWLGVVPYLTLPAFRTTVAFLATRPAGSGVTLDYGQPRSVLPFYEQLAHDSLASRVQLAGEPFQIFFTPAEIAAEFAGFATIEDVGSTEINARYFSNRTDDLKLRGSAGRFFSAWR